MGDNGVVAGGYAVVFVVAFSTTFAMGVVHGTGERRADAALSVLKAMERRVQMSIECSKSEQFVNVLRAKQHLPPLSFREV